MLIPRINRDCPHARPSPKPGTVACEVALFGDYPHIGTCAACLDDAAIPIQDEWTRTRHYIHHSGNRGLQLLLSDYEDYIVPRDDFTPCQKAARRRHIINLCKDPAMRPQAP